MTQYTRRLTADHDMTFGSGLGNFCTGAESTAIQVETRLLTLLGEWFLDVSAGVPYMQQIFSKPADLQLATTVFKAQIYNTDGIATVDTIEVYLDHSTRQATVSASGTTVDGDIWNIDSAVIG